MKKCYVVLVEGGDYDCSYTSIKGIYLDKTDADNFAIEFNESQKHKRWRNREYVDVEEYELKEKSKV